MKTKELIVPITFDDITLKQWQDFVAEGEDISDERLISIMCNVTPQEVFELPNSVYGQAVSLISILLKSISDEHILNRRFWMGGLEYGMIPNLNEISYGENKDIIAFLGDWKNMHLAMTVLFRPITAGTKDTYAIEKYDGKLLHQDKMLEMPLSIVLGAQVFFWNLTRELLRCIPSYLERQLKIAMKDKTQQQLIRKNGEAMMNHIASLKEISEGLMR